MEDALFGSEKYGSSAYEKIDATPIAPQIYQGSVPPSGTRLSKARFSMLVLAAKEHQPRPENFPGVHVVYAPIDDTDTPTRKEIDTVVRTALMVSDHVRKGGKVLITCMQGRNRSGLITTLVLRDLYGFSGEQAVSQVKALRPRALTNESFVKLVSSLPSRTPRVVGERFGHPVGRHVYHPCGDRECATCRDRHCR